LNRCFLYLIILVLIVVPSVNITAQNVYPGKTITIEPSFSAGFQLPLSDSSNGNGGGLQFALGISDIIENVNFEVFSKYSYITDSEENPVNYLDFGFYGGYSFYVLKFMSINPFAGFSILLPLKSENNLVAASTLGCELGFQIFKRNLLALSASIEIPFNSDISPSLFFQFRIKHSIPIMINVPPVSMTMNISPQVFSPDNDGVNDILEINLKIQNKKSVKKWDISVFDFKNNQIRSWNGVDLPQETIEWDGCSTNGDLILSATDYRIVAQLEDKLGNNTFSSYSFLSDILVEKENSRYKIRIPSIVFPPDSADMNLLTNEELEKNELIIKMIAEKLKKFPNYKIRIEGHGNIEEWETEELALEEQRTILLPLTEKRARVIKNALITLGLSEERLSVVGLGGTFPLVPFNDSENRWKNRRVDFILLK